MLPPVSWDTTDKPVLGACDVVRSPTLALGSRCPAPGSLRPCLLVEGVNRRGSRVGGGQRGPPTYLGYNLSDGLPAVSIGCWEYRATGRGFVRSTSRVRVRSVDLRAEVFTVCFFPWVLYRIGLAASEARARSGGFGALRAGLSCWLQKSLSSPKIMILHDGS